MKLQIRISAAVATCDAARKLDTNLADVPDPSQGSFGRFGGSIFANSVVNTDGAGARLPDTWLRGSGARRPGLASVSEIAVRTKPLARRTLRVGTNKQLPSSEWTAVR
jgi:hypothetical protein